MNEYPTTPDDSAVMLSTAAATSWPRAHGQALGHALLRCEVEDFQVDECLKHEPTGAGEHLWLRVEKRGANTVWVARQLARWAQVPVRAVSYAGLKDRHALTRQSFSIHLPGRADPDLDALAPLAKGEFQVLAQQRSARKLQRGALAGNQFCIRLRQCVLDPQALAQRITQIQQQGVPNYFGEQRFGHDNLQQAYRSVVEQSRPPRERDLRSLYFSVLRSYLFNRVLATRVENGSWQQILPGDRVMLAGTQSWFQAQSDDMESLAQRCAALDIHPSGPLPGREKEGQDSLAVEQTILAPQAHWVAALAQHGLEAQRRPLRLCPQALRVEASDQACTLYFGLPAGAYATVVMREIVDYTVVTALAVED